MEEMDAETRRQYLAEFDMQHLLATMHFLSTLKQTSTVADLQEEFEDLIQGVTGISDPLLISYFISALRPEIQREMLRLMRPSTLVETFSLACACEARIEEAKQDPHPWSQLQGPTRSTITLIPTSSSTIVIPNPPALLIPSARSPTPTGVTFSGNADPSAPCLQPPTISPDLQPSISPPSIFSPDPFPSPSPFSLSSNPVPLSNPLPDPHPDEQKQDIAGLQDLSEKAYGPKQSGVEEPEISHQARMASPKLFSLSKPPPHPPDPDRMVKREDYHISPSTVVPSSIFCSDPSLLPCLRPDPDSRKKMKELPTPARCCGLRTTKNPRTSSAVTTKRRGPASFLKLRYVSMDHYKYDWSVVKHGWDARVLGVAPHQILSVIEAVRSRRCWVLLVNRFFNILICEGVVPTPSIYNTLLLDFSLSMKMDMTTRVLEGMKMQEFEPEIEMPSMLLSSGVRAKQVDDGEEVFVEMPHKSCRTCIHLDSLIIVTVFINSTSLQASKTIDSLPIVVMQYGFESIHLVGFASLNVYAKGGNVTDSYMVFVELNCPNSVSCQGMIAANDLFGEPLVLLEQMWVFESLQNSLTLMEFRHDYIGYGSLELWKSVHTYIDKVGMSSHVSVIADAYNLRKSRGPIESIECSVGFPVHGTFLAGDNEGYAILWGAQVQGEAPHNFQGVVAAVKMTGDVGKVHDEWPHKCTASFLINGFASKRFHSASRQLFLVIQRACIHHTSFTLIAVYIGSAGAHALTTIDEIHLNSYAMEIFSRPGVLGGLYLNFPKIIVDHEVVFLGVVSCRISLPHNKSIRSWSKQKEWNTLLGKYQMEDATLVSSDAAVHRVMFRNKRDPWLYKLYEFLDAVDSYITTLGCTSFMKCFHLTMPPDSLETTCNLVNKPMRMLFSIQCFYNVAKVERLHLIVLKILIHWPGRPPEDVTCSSLASFYKPCPNCHLEDKVVLKGGGIDTTLPVVWE